MDSATIEESVKWIDERLQSNLFTQHVVVNVAKIVNMRSDKSLYASVESCDLINIDGMGVVWGARFLGHKVPERVPGVELFYELLKLSVSRNYSVFFLGAKPEIVEKVVEVASQDYAGLEIAGYNHGYFWDDERVLVQKIKDSRAKLLFVAISSPKKENFINRWKAELGVDFVMGVGGTFDVVAGKVKRAPVWMQKAGLEWFYRVIQEPRRMWKRYLVTNSVFAWMLLKEKLREKR